MSVSTNPFHSVFALDPDPMPASPLKKGIHHSIHSPQDVGSAQRNTNIDTTNTKSDATKKTPSLAPSSTIQYPKTTPTHVTTATHSQRHPTTNFFLVRPSGPGDLKPALVPLIPVDLLPDHIEISGLPRSLAAEQAAGMTSVGAVERPVGSPARARYELRFVHGPEVDYKREVNRDALVVRPSCGVYRRDSSEGGDDDEEEDDDNDEADEISNVEGNGSSCIGSGNSDIGRSEDDDDDDEKSTAYSPIPVTASSTSPAKKGADKKGASIAAIPPSATSTSSRPIYDAGTTSSPEAAHRILKAAAAASAHHLLVPTTKYSNSNSNNNNGKKSSEGKNRAQNDKDTHENPTTGTSTTTTTSGNYCRHFCVHGTCKFGLACRFQHSMPVTPEGLREMGLKEWPPWFRTAVRLITLDGRFVGGAAGSGGKGGGVTGGLEHVGLGGQLGAGGMAATHHHGHFQNEHQQRFELGGFPGVINGASPHHHHHHHQQQQHMGGMNMNHPAAIGMGMGTRMGLGMDANTNPFDRRMAALSATAFASGHGSVPGHGGGGATATNTKHQSGAEKTKREKERGERERERERRKAEERMRMLETERAEMEKADKLKEARAMKMSAAHEAAEATAKAVARERKDGDGERAAAMLEGLEVEGKGKQVAEVRERDESKVADGVLVDI